MPSAERLTLTYPPFRSCRDSRNLVRSFPRRLESLGDATLRRIALLKMEGFSNDEIAAQLDCGLRSVVRKLDVIRKRWLREVTS